jgi:hypothetical protein
VELPFSNPAKHTGIKYSLLNKMSRATRYPPLIYIGLLLVIGMISFKYFKLAAFTSELKNQIYSSDERLNQYTFEKSSLEKEKEVCLGRIKFFEDRIEQNQQALNKKDSEINDLNQRLKDSEYRLEQHKSDLNQRLKDSESKFEQNKLEIDAKLVGFFLNVILPGSYQS